MNWLWLYIISLVWHSVKATKIGVIYGKHPRVIVSGLEFQVSLFFPPTGIKDQLFPRNLQYTVFQLDLNTKAVGSGKISTRPVSDDRVDGCRDGFPSTLTIGNVEPTEFGKHSYRIVLESSHDHQEPNSDSFEYIYDFQVWCIPGWMTLLPPVVTIVIAMTLKQGLLAMFAGTVVGATLTYGMNPILGLARTLDTAVIQGMTDPEHCSAIYFCLLIGGMVGIVGKGGGGLGMAKMFTRFASTRLKSQLSTWIVGVLIFFDDYASCLITGSTMKDVTARLIVSREKFSFIVDTCASTVSSLMIISSWTAIEIGYISEIIRGSKITGLDPYTVFIETIPYRSYPILILFFCLASILMDRDFGPMLAAEIRAQRTGKLIKEGSVPLSSTGNSESYLTPKTGKSQRWYNAVAPFLVLVSVVLVGMMVEGYFQIREVERDLEHQIQQGIRNSLEEHVDDLIGRQQSLVYSLRNILGQGSPFHALLWASFLGTVVAGCLVISQNILSVQETLDAWSAGAKSMLEAVLILIHAWGLGTICEELQTPHYIASMLAIGGIPKGLLPTLVFVVAALISFSTGSAWGTMSLLFPLLVPITKQLEEPTMLAVVSSVLSGSVWGNHVSPISDSCIMTSMACGSDHMDHIRTQGVYALVVGALSVAVCTLPVGMGFYSQCVGLLIGCVAIAALLFLVGQSPVDNTKSGTKALGHPETLEDTQP